MIKACEFPFSSVCKSVSGDSYHSKGIVCLIQTILAVFTSLASGCIGSGTRTMSSNQSLIRECDVRKASDTASSYLAEVTAASAIIVVCGEYGSVVFHSEYDKFPYLQYYAAKGADPNYVTETGLPLLALMLHSGHEQMALEFCKQSKIGISDDTIRSATGVALRNKQFTFLAAISDRIKKVLGVSWCDLGDVSGRELVRIDVDSRPVSTWEKDPDVLSPLQFHQQYGKDGSNRQPSTVNR